MAKTATVFCDATSSCPVDKDTDVSEELVSTFYSVLGVRYSETSVKDKGKVHLRTGHETQKWSRLYTFFNLGARWGAGGGNATSGRFIPEKDTRYKLYSRLDGPPGTVWTGVENIAPTGIRSPDRPTRSELLRLCLSERLHDFASKETPARSHFVV
jgi:hypothetical protein